MACGRVVKLRAVPSGSVVLAFGDSVTFGTGAAPGEDWPSRLAAMTQWSEVNAGIPGDTAEAAKGRLQALLDDHQPALVIVELGGNDFLRRRSSSAVKSDLREIVRAIKAAGISVVLVAVPEPSLLGVVTRKPSDAAIYAELGSEEGVPVVDAVFSDVLSRAELRADAIHPNADGYRQMAEGIFQRLTKLGLVPAR